MPSIATPVDGIIGTKRVNASDWKRVIPSAVTPASQWTPTFTKTEVNTYFQAGEIEDILCISTFCRPFVGMAQVTLRDLDGCQVLQQLTQVSNIEPTLG